MVRHWDLGGSYSVNSEDVMTPQENPFFESQARENTQVTEMDEVEESDSISDAPDEMDNGIVIPDEDWLSSDTSKPSRSWFYTLNNYTEAEYELFIGVTDNVSYHVVGKEIAPTTGTPHLQGCITFKQTKRLGAVRELLPRAHHQIVRMIDHARTYCKKDNRFWESGPQPFAGRRSDIQAAVDTLLENRDLQMVAQEHPVQYVKYFNGFAAVLRDSHIPQRQRPKVYWISGPTGTGKSKYVVDKVGVDNLYISSNGLKWFDGYNNQSSVLFDDFRASHIDVSYLLRLLDGYPVRVEVKGSSRQFNAHVIYITSPYGYDQVYDWGTIGENSIQLARRIYKIMEFTFDVEQSATIVSVRKRINHRGEFNEERCIRIPWGNQELEEDLDSDEENYT